MRPQREMNHLFNDVDWFAVERSQRERMLSEIDSIEGNRLLNTSVDDLCAYFANTYSIDVPVLDEEGITADQQEVQIDVSRDPMRAIRDRSRPFHIAGTVVRITLPFKGEAEAFRIQPTTYTLNPPRAIVADGSITLSIEGTQLDAEQVRHAIDRELGSIKSSLSTLRENARTLNTQLPKLARERIERRRDKLLKDQNLVAALGFPLKERADAPRTYAAPQVKRRLAPRMPVASTAAYKPEPVLAMEDYEHILSVMTNMALVMERSPSAFTSMDEEALRSHFLVQLNGHYEGQASAETFNYEGKTDILIRANGRNIFIAECKYWPGPRKLTDTIDQLLGYASWRDTKVAIVLFNRNKDFSRVLDAIPEAVKGHQSFKRELGCPSESSFRYVFSHRDDANRELTLTVLAFDIPRAAASA